MLRRSTIVAGLLVLVLGPASAQTSTAKAVGEIQFLEEFGTMWTFDAPPLAYWKATYDFAPDQAWLDHVRLASVRLPNCSSSFVSADGLVLTNHHCARSCISAVSPADTNYQETGFVAQTRAEEKACPNLWVDQLLSIEDVTDDVRAAITADAPARQVAQRDSITTVLEEACSADTGDHCQVVRFYQGGMYSLYRYHRFSDVRLVMAPEEHISFFGGDPDNFTYPRFDLDFTLLRVYQDGEPRPTEHYFPWSDHGADEGELVFVTGNPGSTGRLLTMAQMEYLRDADYPARLKSYQARLGVLRELAAESDEAARQYQNQIFGLENAHKAVSGYLRGLDDPEIMSRKASFESDFRDRIAADPELQARYGDAWDRIAEAQGELGDIAPLVRHYRFAGSQLFTMAGGLVRLPQQRALPDSLRLSQYRGEGMERIAGYVMGEVSIDPAMEKMTLAATLTAAQAELPADDPFLAALLQGRSPEVAAEALIDGTRLADQSYRALLFEGGTEAVNASDDPLLAAALTVEPLARAVADRAAELNAVISANAELVGQAIFSAYGTSLPPDATFTLRISDGVVKRYPMNGTVAPPVTNFYGLYARAAAFGHEPPWQLPERWLERRDLLDLETPLNFVSTNDIIGGNSGSPVINRNAEVVGLIFDGNIEQLPNRFIFTNEVSRSVSVHSAGIMEALRKIYDAAHLADELTGTTVTGSR